MDADDPRRPLLGHVREDRFRRTARKLCGLESWRRRVPITIWLPKYTVECLVRDIIAGITVGLTSIPQGIAYAMVAGLPPQVGLYSSIFPGVMYAVFGSRKEVTVGPTAILAALLAKYVARSPDFAYLAAFLSGCVILLLGVLQLGFLLDFISKPVISGFTTAAALQISAAQLKSLFRISGKSGDTFVTAVVNFFENIKTVQLWDTVLGISTIIALVLLKKSTISTSNTSSAWRVNISSAWLYVVRARNALVVFATATIAYVLHLRGVDPFALTGKVEGGLPHFGPPPFSTVVNNQTVYFDQMLAVFGAEGLVMPLVAILESIAIAKAFAGSTSVDATQEMLAIGVCNVASSFCRAMPSTGSFTRTALNHASGVMTPAGSFFKAGVVLVAVTQLAAAFAYIPRATLAAVIAVAMLSIVDFAILPKLWTSSKSECLVWAATLAAGAGAGLEYGIALGAAADALRALAYAARPQLQTTMFKVGHQDCVSITLVGSLSYASAEYVPRAVRKHIRARSLVFVLDARHLKNIDIGVAEAFPSCEEKLKPKAIKRSFRLSVKIYNLISVMVELEKQRHRFLLWNFSPQHQRTFETLRDGIADRFVTGPSIDQHILGLEISRGDNPLNTVT